MKKLGKFCLSILVLCFVLGPLYPLIAQETYFEKELTTPIQCRHTLEEERILAQKNHYYYLDNYFTKSGMMTHFVYRPEINEYLNWMWNELIKGLPPQVAHNFAYQLTIVDLKTVNAEAKLGGYVYVNLGILEFVDSPDVLCMVLAHELGHCVRRAVMVYTEFWETKQYPKFLQLLFRLNEELLADKFATRLSMKLGFDPIPFARMFLSCPEWNGFGHPHGSKRAAVIMEDVQKVLDQHLGWQPRPLKPDAFSAFKKAVHIETERIGNIASK